MSVNEFNTVQSAIIDQDNRNQAAAGIPMSQTLNDLFALIATGTIGIQSQAPDVDSLCLGGGAFGYDPSLSSGLNFGFRAGRCLVGRTVQAVASGTVLLNASATNYVELNPSGSGSIVANTSAFTVGRVPLYIVVTGPSSISIVNNAKVLLWAPASGVIAGVQLSQSASTKSIEINLGAISGTATFLVFPPVAATLTAAIFGSQTAITVNGTNYWTFTLTEGGAAGSGTTVMLDTGLENTTNTGGSAIIAKQALALELTATGGNLVVAANDSLQFTITATGSPTTMNGCTLRLDFQFTN